MRSLLWSALLVSSGTIAACRSSDCSADATCIAEVRGSGDGDGGASDGGAPPAKVPDGCDPAADAKDAPLCAVSSFAIFVDAGGDDANAGTPNAPVRSIQAALSKLDGRSRIYVCEGTYEEAFTLGRAIAIHGGFGCGDWRFTGTKARVAPKAESPAVHIRDVKEVITFSDLDIRAPAATAAGGSSIGLFAASSGRIVLRRVSITAGAGMAADPSAEIQRASPAPPGSNGNAAPNPGGRTANPECPTSIGGAARTTATASEAGMPMVSPALPSDATGAGGGPGTTCVDGRAGQTGSNGHGGAAGKGADRLGRLTAAGWEGGAGEEGGRGGLGQGGGGGAWIDGTAGPGGGAPGGCGGAGGKSGRAGGSSIAIASFESMLVIVESTIEAASSGRGGAGGKGQTGQFGGKEGQNFPGSNSCVGGHGGAGGSGGGGGGGAGGLSIGVLYVGPAPSLDGADVDAADAHAAIKVVTAGPRGGAGAGGEASVPGGAGVQGEPGIEGVAKAVLAAP